MTISYEGKEPCDEGQILTASSRIVLLIQINELLTILQLMFNKIAKTILQISLFCMHIS